MIVEDDTDPDYVPSGQRSKPAAKKIVKVKEVEEKKRIAAEIKRHPCIWDKKDKCYRNAPKREAAWSKVAAEMNTTGMIFLASISSLCVCIIYLKC